MARLPALHRQERPLVTQRTEMARAGGRAGKVLSSGRVTVPVRPVNCKKRATVRKFSTTSVDSGYSLCSTDSEDQVLVINKGLDRCASLLQDILQNDAIENSLKPHKMPFPKASVKTSTVRVKKSALRRPVTASHVYKEKGSLRKSVAYGASNVDVQRPCVSAQSLVAHTRNCDHVHTQMQHLHRTSSQGSGNAASAPLLSEQGAEAAALFNCRLPTSTPALSPQHAGNPQNWSNEGYHQTLLPGGAPHFPSTTRISPALTVPPAMYNTQAPAPNCYPTDILSQLSNYKNQIQDSELLQCVAAHLSQLQSQGLPETAGEREGPTQETDETSGDEEDVAPVREISCQTSFNLYKKNSPEKTEKKINTVKYLLGEIKALVADQDDGEALRLVTELEHSLSLLPAVIGSTHLHAEIALALQPLRSENAQLRRRLRILNQQLRDRERGARSDEQNYELTSLQSMNETLQHQLNECQERLASLQSKNEDLVKVIKVQQEEKRTSAQTLQEKEQELLDIRQQNDITSAAMKTGVDEAAGRMRSVQFKLDSSEKENQILGITLRQRDAEVSRLRELTRTLQASMAKLLCDLGKDNSAPKRESPLTQAALGSYEKQLQNDQCPASTSIINYLKRLETDQVLTSTDTIFSDKPLPNTATQLTYNNGMTSDRCDQFTVSKAQVSHPGPESTGVPVPPYNLQKHQPELGSESCYLTSDEYKPDETTYLPLASSPHKGHLVSYQRQMCTPPKVCSADRDFETGSAYTNHGGFSASGVQENSTNTPDTLDKTRKVHREIFSMDPLPKDPSLTHPPILQQMRNLQVHDNHPSDQSVCDFRSGKSDWTICSFSTFTSHDEHDFRNGLAALDANIAKLQRTLQTGIKK